MLFGLCLKAVSKFISVDVFSWMILHCVGSVLCIIGCLAFVYSYQMLMASSQLWQMSPDDVALFAWGTKCALAENH